MPSPLIIGELQRIAQDAGGELRVADVVEAARAASSPLHGSFNWDDSEAAHAYRLQQARQLIRISVAYIGDSEDSVSLRVFVSLTPDRYNENGGGYRIMTSVLSDKKQRAQLLQDALDEMHRFQAKYGALKELASVFGEMTKAQRMLRFTNNHSDAAD